MYLLNVCNVLALIQASAWAVTVSPQCNQDNCLRGLFGSNVRSTSANLAACSTGLPAVTVSVDGTSRTTMTGTAPLPAVASVCDGQGADKRAARFQSACSCVGVLPSTVTQSSTATTIAASAQITLGQLATTGNALQCNLALELVQFSRSSAGSSYTIPKDGQIISATTFALAAGVVTFEVWRPLNPSSTDLVNTYTLVGKGDPTTLAANSGIVSLALPAPIPVQAGDLIGIYASRGASCYGFSADDFTATKFASDGASSQGAVRTFIADQSDGLLVNVAAILQ